MFGLGGRLSCYLCFSVLVSLLITVVVWVGLVTCLLVGLIGFVLWLGFYL